MDTRLTLSVATADGRVKRWGPDSPDPADIPRGLRFSTAIPGGFKTLNHELVRRIDQDYPDLGLLNEIRAYGAGNETAWEGRHNAFPRDHGTGYAIHPDAVGFASHLRDNPAFSEIYMDRDLSRYQGPSVQRQLNMIALGRQTRGPVTGADPTTGNLSIINEFPGPAVNDLYSEAWYDAGGGVTVARFRADFTAGAGINPAGADWSWLAAVTEDDLGSSATSSGDLSTGVTGTVDFTPATARRWLLLELLYTGSVSVDGDIYRLFWHHPRVIGNHGLTLQAGTALTEGFLGSDIIADVVARTAPKLTYTTGSSGSIQPTTFKIPHLAFHGVRGEDAILACNAFQFWPWGVYDNKEFFYRPWDPDRLTWEARLSEGAQLRLEGQQADDIFNGIFVTYTNPAGERKSVGPPGAQADNTDADLADTSESNPANQWGYGQMWARLDISQVTTLEGATAVGRVALAEKAYPQHRGTLTVTGTVRHPTKGLRPAWAVRAGDYIRISDHPDDIPRRIIETDYNHDTLTVSCQLDNTSHLTTAILERFGAVLHGVL